jgi:hypothetical protein
MNDDWRVQVTCPTEADASSLNELLRAGDFQHELSSAAGERVIVSLDGRELFLYAGSRAQADTAAQAVRSLLQRSGATTNLELRRWHPVAEDWVDADLPLPESEAAISAEHGETVTREREEQAGLKYPEYEVRVSTDSHRETVELADRLEQSGITCLRRWRFLLIGATDEDAAQALAERVRGLAGHEARVQVEATYTTVAAEVGTNPFAVFGGLGV